MAYGRTVLARLFVLVGGFIVLALTVVLVAPYFIDWTSYRSDFEREASRILGRQVTVAGRADARLLPFPSVTFSNVTVAGDASDEPSLTIEKFSMDAELAPFMRGEILIFDMRLTRPVLTIDVAENGLIDWTIRPNTGYKAGQIKLERISVSDGLITVRHAAGDRDFVLDHIDADISARTLAGPWRIGAKLRFDGAPMTVAVSTGTPGSDGAMRLRLRVEPEDAPLALETDGDVRITDAGAVYAGQFRLVATDDRNEGTKGEDTPFAISIEEEEKPALPFRISGRFNADHRLIDIDEFLLESGDEADPYTAEGSAFLDFDETPRFSIQAEGRQVRFDEPDTGDAEAQPLSRRVAQFREMVQVLPRPTVPGTVNFDLPAIVAGDTTIRKVRLSAEPREGGWHIANLAAELPGRTTLEAEGLLTTGQEFGFHGSMLLAIAQPSGFAAWLSDDVDEAIRRLPAAGFSANVDLNSERQTFRDLELILGNARFAGEIDHLVPADAKPSMLLRLDGGALDVDGLAAFAAIFIDDAGSARFADHDLDLVVDAGPVSVAGLRAGTISTAIRLKDGLLDIDRLSIGELAGATISATGKIRNFPESPTGNLDASIVAVDLEPLAELLAARYPQNALAAGLAERAAAFPGLLTETRIDLVGSGAANDDGSLGFAISAHGMTGGNRFSLSGSATRLDGRFDGPLTATLTMQAPDAAPLIAAYGLPAIYLGLTGPAESSLTISGEAGGLFETNVLLRGERTQMTFEGWSGHVDGEWQATGEAKVASDDIEPWLVTSGLALPGFGYGLPMDIRAEIDRKGSELRVAGLAGSADGGPVTADLTAKFGEPLLDLSGAISVQALDLSPLAGMLIGDGALAASADGGLPAVPFAPNADFPLTGQFDLEVGSLEVGIAEPLKDAALVLAIQPGGIRVSGLDALYRDGRLSGIAEARNSDGTLIASAQMKYAEASLAGLAATDAIGGAVTLSANINASGKSVAGLMSALSGSGTALLEDPVIPGVNPDVFAAFIAEADRIGRDIDADDVSDFATALVASNPFAAGETEFTFVVAGGVLRTPAIVFEGDKANLTAEFNANLNIGEAEATAEITYDPGREALVGAAPTIRVVSAGQIGAMEAHYDTAPLAQFLTQRALEIEQYRVESLQAGLLEKQRLRREVRYYASLEQERLDAAEALRQQQEAEEAIRRQLEEEKALERRGEEAAPDEPDAVESGDGSGIIGGGTPPTLEDEVRRVLDEEARRRTLEGANLDEEGETPIVSVEPIPQPRPGSGRDADDETPIEMDAGGAGRMEDDTAETGTGDNAARSAFDPLSIDRFLRSLDR